MRRLRQKTNKKKHSKVNCDKKSCVYPKKEINLTDKSVIKYFKCFQNIKQCTISPIKYLNVHGESYVTNFIKTALIFD